MTIKFRLAIAVSSLLFVLSMQPAAKADVIHATAETNFPACAASQLTCIPINLSVDFTTMLTADTGRDFGGPTPLEPFIESMTGTLNGYPVFLETGTWVLPPGYGPGVLEPPLFFTSPGLGVQQGEIRFDDQIFGSFVISLVDQSGGGSESLVTWNGALVSTPEPSALLLLVFGTGALLVGYALFKNKAFSA